MVNLGFDILSCGNVEKPEFYREKLMSRRAVKEEKKNENL